MEGMDGGVTGGEDRKSEKEKSSEDKRSADKEREEGIEEEGMEGAGEAPLVPISRNAELGDVSDFLFFFWWPDFARRTSGARLFFGAPAVCLKQLRFHKGCLAVFMLVSRFHQTFFGGAQE